jgi:uncharacterized membrane protein YdjX (TVP38/TMEM64 family)
MEHQIHQLISGAGIAGPVLYVAAEAAIALLFLPRSAGAIVAGALFGTAAGTLLTWLGLMLGAAGAFAIGRGARRAGNRFKHLAPERSRAQIADWVKRLDRWMERRGSLALLYSRLIPGMPFTSINYAAGMTPIRWRPYLVATAIGVLPGAYLLVALGGSLAHPTSVRFIVVVILIVALSILAPLADRAIRQRTTATRGV